MYFITSSFNFHCNLMIKNHPFQFIYFNKFAGKNIENYFELDYSGTSNKSALNYLIKNNKKKVLNIYILSASPYHFSLSMIDKNQRDRIKFVNNKNDADFLLTNHYYTKGNPAVINLKLKKEFELLKEFKVDDMPINTIFKMN